MESEELLKYPQGPEEVVKYMDYVEDEKQRMGLLMQFVLTAVTN